MKQESSCTMTDFSCDVLLYGSAELSIDKVFDAIHRFIDETGRFIYLFFIIFFLFLFFFFAGEQHCFDNTLGIIKCPGTQV